MVPTCCPFPACGKFFTHSGNLEYHINLHKGIKPYKCDLCAVSYRGSAHLKHHVAKVHSDKPRVAPKVRRRKSNGVAPKARSKQPGGGEVPKARSRKHVEVAPKTRSKKPVEVAPKARRPIGVAPNVRSTRIENTNPLEAIMTQRGITRAVSVQIRPEDRNQVRLYKQLKESLFWKRAMHHLFNVPYEVINPEFSNNPETNAFWHSPLDTPYHGFIPISKLPDDLQCIHDDEEHLQLNKVEHGWDSALISFDGIDAECGTLPNPHIQLSDTVTETPRERAIVVTQNSDDSLQIASKCCRYCNKWISLTKIGVHIAAHKGHGFKVLRCRLCGQRFLSRKKYADHMKWHVLSTTNDKTTFEGMPTLTPVFL